MDPGKITSNELSKEMGLINKVIKTLNKINNKKGTEQAHIDAAHALLVYINEPEITNAHKRIGKPDD